MAAILPAVRELGPPQASWLAHSLVLLGDARLQQGRGGEAIASLREAVSLREKLLWSGSWELAEARARLGEALLAGGEPGGVELLAQAAAALPGELGGAPQTRRRQGPAAR